MLNKKIVIIASGVSLFISGLFIGARINKKLTKPDIKCAGYLHCIDNGEEKPYLFLDLDDDLSTAKDGDIVQFKLVVNDKNAS